MFNSRRRGSCGFRGYTLVSFSLLAGGACGPNAVYEERTYSPATPPELQSVADWEKSFQSHWQLEHLKSFLPMSTSGDSWELYSLAYGIDGNTAMYRATGKLQYLDRALLYANNAVNSARGSWVLPGSQFKDGYRGWASQHPETKGMEVPLNESYCWRYVTRMLRVIRETPELYNDGRYRAAYERLLEFSERDIFEKWYRRGAESYIYRGNTHMASHWAYIAMNLALMTTDQERKTQYLDVVNNINRDLPNSTSSLRQQMKPSPANPAAYFWSDVWGSSSRPGQDTPHGNGVISYIVEAHDAGIEWTDDDIRKFVATLSTVVWPSASKYANYVDGSGNLPGWMSDGWMKLGRYDASLQRRLESHTVGRTIQFYGNGALNARILSGQPTR
jgi:hypothetical protein